MPLPPNKAEPKKWVAVVYKIEFKPGEFHSNHSMWDSDRASYQKVGDLWSWGTEDQLANPLPYYYDVVPLDGPPEPGDTWDREARCFRKWHENKTLVQERIDFHAAELDKYQKLL